MTPKVAPEQSQSVQCNTGRDYDDHCKRQENTFSYTHPVAYVCIDPARSILCTEACNAFNRLYGVVTFLLLLYIAFSGTARREKPIVELYAGTHSDPLSRAGWLAGTLFITPLLFITTSEWIMDESPQLFFVLHAIERREKSHRECDRGRQKSLAIIYWQTLHFLPSTSFDAQFEEWRMEHTSNTHIDT